MRYETVQSSPLILIGYAAGCLPFAVAMLLPMPLVPALVLAGSGLFTTTLCMCFSRLVVRDDGEHLVVEFGPIPGFGLRLPYADLVSVRRGRTTFLEGWGLKYSWREGWTFNIWGYDCVLVETVHGRKYRIGTPDPDGLIEFLQEVCEGQCGN